MGYVCFTPQGLPVDLIVLQVCLFRRSVAFRNSFRVGVHGAACGVGVNHDCGRAASFVSSV